MKSKKLLYSFMTSAVVLTGGVLVACNNDPNKGPVKEPGPESGVYYCYDLGQGGGYVSLSEVDKVSFRYGETTVNGTYKKDDTVLTLKLAGVGEITATLIDDVITFEYNSEQLSFWKDIDYTVSYSTDGGSAVPSSSVKYGSTFSAPSDPTRGSDVFVGWFTSAGGNDAYDFNTRVTGNVTLYAKWLTAGDNEYALGFDLGYDGGTAIPPARTTGGRAYNLPTPTRDGYTFKGWWVSQYDDATKLSYKCNVGETEIGTDTVLYAKWQKDGEQAPDITVTNKAISWERTGAAVKLTVSGPSGYGANGVTEDNFGATGAASKALDFDAAPEGDYVITLESNGNKYSVYYKNKAVYAVSGLKVTDNTELSFDKVDGADKYYISVECGTLGHNHTMVDNGNKTTYDFSACDMQPDGIVFTVYAAANGKATSVGRKYVHEAHLSAVDASSYVLDGETGVLNWGAVENAQSYSVSVNGGVSQEVTTPGFNLNNYNGEVTVRVTPRGHGYNPGEASEYKYTRTNLSTPVGLTVSGSTLTWESVDGAGSYEIRVGGKVLTSNTNSVDLNGGDVDWQENREYFIDVRAVDAAGGNKSYWSNATSAVYTPGAPEPRYTGSTVEWAHSLGVTGYEVRINDGQPVRTTSNSMDVVLTQKGNNTISVRSLTANGASEWNTITVYAYEITFETAGGVPIGNYYKATGDSFTLPTSTRNGYEFVNWMTAPENGAVYDQSTFTGTNDLRLYATWSPKEYTLALNFGAYGKLDDVTTATVTFGEDFTLPVPQTTDARMQFIGWNAAANGSGTAYTDYKGMSVLPWYNYLDGVTVYACYAEAFEFIEDGDGYAISAGREIDRVSEIVIPDSYNGKNVRSVNERGFANLANIRSVSVPSTVKAIPETAFNRSTNIERFSSYVSDREPTATYFAADGMLLYNNGVTGETELAFLPKVEGDTLTVPYGVTALGTKIFDSLKVKEIILPASVKRIAIDAFYRLSALEKVTFLKAPEGVEVNSLEIDPKAFNGCTNITELVLPGRLAAWGEGGDVASVLAQFTKLKKITVEGGSRDTTYSSDENGMLLNGAADTIIFCPMASELTEYVVPTGILSIGDGAFQVVRSGTSSSSRKLSSVVFHNQMIRIGERAFYNVSSLNAVQFTASATAGVGMEIGREAFRGCNLTNIDFAETGALNADNVYVATTTCSVKTIGESAFSGSDITSLVLPSSLTAIGDSAFSGSDMLSDLDFGHIRADLKFGSHVFSGCFALRSVEITPNIGVIQFSSVFGGCKNLADIDVGNNPNYAVDAGVIYNKDFTQLVYIPESVDLGTYAIKSTVTSLAGGIFRDRTDITRFTVPAAVKEIGESAFYGCVGLSEIIFESDAANVPLTIGASAFAGCTSLKTVIVPSRTASLGDGCFANSGLTQVTFEEGVTSIAANAFKGVATLTTVNIASTVSTIGEYAFYNTGVTAVNFARANENTGAKTYGASVFESCKNLSEIVLPEGLQYMPESMFRSCAALTHVVIPTTVENLQGTAGVGKAAFYDCSLLSNIEFTKGGTMGVSFGEHSLYNTMSLTTLNLPERAAPLTKDSYDVLAMSSKKGYEQNLGVFDVINDTLFMPRSALTAITVNGEANGSGINFATFDGVLYTAGHKMAVYCPEGYQGSTSAVSGKEHTVTIAKEAETIRPGAFKNCLNIRNVEFEDADNTSDELPGFSIPNSTMATMVFYGCINIESISFPARLTSLGDYALWSRNSHDISPCLTSVTFAEGCKLKTIGARAFTYAEFTAIDLPDGVETIGDFAFSYTKLDSIVLPSSLTEIGDRAFVGSSLSSVTFNDKLVTIGAGAFNGLKNLTSVALPDTLTKLGEGSFAGTGLTEVHVPSGVVEFPADASGETLKITGAPFNGCRSLQTMTVGSMITLDSLMKVLEGTPTKMTVNMSDDNGNYSVENGIIYEKSTVEVEGTEYAVRKLVYCPADLVAENLVIGADVVEIAANVFNERKGVADVTFAPADEGMPSFSLVIGDNAFKASGVTSVTLPGRLNSLGAGAFQNCKSLETVVLPSGLTTMGNNTFAGCTSLNTVVLPSVLTTIGDYAFDGCTAFTGNSENGLVLPDNLNAVGAYAFRNNKALAHVKVTNEKTGAAGWTTLSNYTFQNCTALVDFVLPDKESMTKIGNYAFDGCTALRYIGTRVVGESGNVLTEKYGLPTTLTSLGAFAFRNCKLLGAYVPSVGEETVSYSATDKSIISNTVNKITEIGAGAFENCASLVNVYIPNSVTNTGFGKTVNSKGTLDAVKASADSSASDVRVFYGCTGLESVTFGSSSKISLISKNAFYGCTHLKAIELPNSVTTIGESAFENCGNALPENDVFTFTLQTSSSLAKIGKAAFKNSALGSIALTAKVASLGTLGTPKATTDARVFEGCSRLTSVDMTASTQTNIKFIGQYMFSGCAKLSTVKFNTRLTTIGSFAFENCNNALEVLTFNNTTTSATTVRFYANSFKDCGKLTTINISGNMATTFDTNAFSGCSKLSTVSFDATASAKAITVNDGAFNGCASNLTFSAPGYQRPESVRNDGGLYTVTLNGDGSVATKTFIGYIGNAEKLGETGTYTLDADTTAIADKALQGNTLIKVLNIPASVVKVGKNAFENSKLERVNFGYLHEGVTAPAAQTIIGSSAFKGVKTLVSLDLTGVSEIGGNAFENAGQLHGDGENDKLVIPQNVTVIAASAFKASAVKKVDLNAAYDASNESSGNPTASWFENCKSLAEVNIGSAMVKIGSKAFLNCSALEKVTFAEDSALTMLGYGVYTASSMMANGNTFENCTSLTEIALPGGVTEVASNTFKGCTSLKMVDLNKVSTIGAGAFDKCSSELAFRKADDNTAVELFDNGKVLTVKSNDEVSLVYKALDAEGTLTVPDGVTEISVYAYYQNSDLKKVKLPNTIKKLSAAAFDSCANLTTVENMNYVTTFEYGALQRTGITSINLSTSLSVVLDSYAFNACKSLTVFNGEEGKLTLGSNISFTGTRGNQFNGCTGIKELVLNTAAGAYTATSAANAFQSCTGLTTLTVGDSVDIIANSMFTSCSKLTGNIVMKGVTSIGGSAFSSVSTTAHFYFDGSKVTSIGSSAFPTTPATTKRVHVVNLGARPSSGWSGISATAQYVEYNAQWPTEEA